MATGGQVEDDARVLCLPVPPSNPELSSGLIILGLESLLWRLLSFRHIANNMLHLNFEPA